jgi:hypothetical protein
MAALLFLNKTNDVTKQVFLIRVTCFFWLLGKLASYKSWIADRSLPTVALFEFLDALPSSVHLISFSLSMLLLSIMVFKPLKILLQLFMVVEIFSVLLDVLRIQPWEYLYLFIIGFHITFISRPLFFYRCLLALVASTYIFSGLHKFNGAFLHIIWDSYFLKKVFGLPYTVIPRALHYAGLFLSIGEFLMGALLLIMRKKTSVVFTLIIMHVFLIVVIAVLSRQPANSVIPWNILMTIILLYILYFSQNSHYDALKIFALPKFSILVILLFWYMLPFSNLFGFWVQPLASGMYTGKPPRVYICWDDFGKGHVPVEYVFSNKKTNICSKGKLLLLNNWAYMESAQAPFQAVWYYQRLYKKLKEKYPNDAIKMVYTYYPFIDIIQIK